MFSKDSFLLMLGSDVAVFSRAMTWPGDVDWTCLWSQEQQLSEMCRAAPSSSFPELAPMSQLVDFLSWALTSWFPVSASLSHVFIHFITLVIILFFLFFWHHLWWGLVQSFSTCRLYSILVTFSSSFLSPIHLPPLALQHSCTSEISWHCSLR